MTPRDIGIVELLRNGAPYHEVRDVYGVSNRYIKQMIDVHEIDRTRRWSKPKALEEKARKFERRGNVFTPPSWADLDDALFEAVVAEGAVFAGVGKFADQRGIPSGEALMRWHKIGREVLV